MCSMCRGSWLAQCGRWRGKCWSSPQYGVSRGAPTLVGWIIKLQCPSPAPHTSPSPVSYLYVFMLPVASPVTVYLLVNCNFLPVTSILLFIHLSFPFLFSIFFFFHVSFNHHYYSFVVVSYYFLLPLSLFSTLSVTPLPQTSHSSPFITVSLSYFMFSLPTLDLILKLLNILTLFQPSQTPLCCGWGENW